MSPNQFVVTRNVPFTPPAVSVTVFAVPEVAADVVRTRTVSPGFNVPAAVANAPPLIE
jgi:hypothetical protein